MHHLVNRRDLDFLLYECLHSEQLCERERYASHDKDTFEAILDTAYRMAKDVFAPHAEKSDHNEPHFDGTTVTIIPEIKEALDAYHEAGLSLAHWDESHGGMQLPWVIVQACTGMFMAANAPTAAYPFLTTAAANLLEAFGSEEQKQTYLPPMLDGRFFGTMCLSEPDVGSSLGDLTTRAEPVGDETYRITGQKMWISGGEHDLSENIIHMVLARLPDAPPGTKGISLFLVPKRRVNPDGSLGELNNVTLAGLNHKMGYRGTINTLLHFGEHGDCLGTMVGKPNKGLLAMFHMMNEARIGVGYGAVMMGYAGYLHSLEYAKERPQGRLPGQKDPTQPQVKLIEHADVKRMLLAQKSYVEGGLALCLYAAHLVDEQHSHPEESARKEAGTLLDILTPICKAWPSDYCLKANDLAIQVLGGAGYTRDYPVERYYRDNRLNPIHEGTNGIQGLDLLGRKAMQNQGEALQLLLQKMQETIDQASAHNEIKEFANALGKACERAGQTTMTLAGAAMQGNISLFLANATVYLNMMGHIVIAWTWLWQALHAVQKLEQANEHDTPFYQGKLQACQYFFRWELPQIYPHADLLESLDDTCLNMDTACF